MDGVVTRTATAHAEAWKRLFDEYLRARAARCGEAFRSFDKERDYHAFVDGKPREDGVSSFLASRGIELPAGEEGDPEDAETVRGLAKRKNRFFLDWLAHHAVHPYPGTVTLIRALHVAGVKTAVFSASRNADAVLASAGVTDIFDGRIDGKELAAHHLPGKPDPAMLVRAAARLQVPPDRAAVIEDAVAGVEAGVRGGFKLVIGVDRGGNADALRKVGADLVVSDPAELTVTSDRSLTIKTADALPRFGNRAEEIRELLAGRGLVVFLDYDGTLTPIVEDFTKAFISEDMRAAVAALAAHCTVAIVSGRDVDVVRGYLKLDSVYYAGSHGFEIRGPGGWTEHLEKGVEYLAELDTTEQELRERLRGVGGHAVERKRFSVEVHYRQVADHDVPFVETVVDTALSKHRSLRKGHGKKVFRIQPDIDWNKGQAVLWLLERLPHHRPDVYPIYVGDDVTDEDAFRALAGRGLCLIVRDHEVRPTAAEYALVGVADVKRFLELLLTCVRAGASTGGSGDG